MLLKKSHIILESLILQSSKFTTVSNLGIDDFVIPLLPDKPKYHWTYDEVSVLLQQLIDEEYINAELFFHGSYPIPDYRHITLTYKGLHYKEFRKNIIKNFILKSVFVPIVVSLLTSAIATFVGYIWGRTILQSQPNNIENPTEEIIETTIDTANE